MHFVFLTHVFFDTYYSFKKHISEYIHEANTKHQKIEKYSDLN